MRSVMRVLCAAALVLVASSTCRALGYWEFYDYPDGTAPPDIVWTGCPATDGSFLVYDSALVHVGGGAVYYVLPYELGWQRQLSFQMRVLGSNWILAWKISMSPGSSGQCLWLSYDELWGGWGYTFAEYQWQNEGGQTCPDAFYMWHNGAPIRTVHYPTAGPLTGWHEVHIWDDSRWVMVSVDGQLIFDEQHGLLADGFGGWGCTGSGAMTPAFDYIMIDWCDPVARSSWGAIKALYR
jgi:hypothetical protein